MPSERIVPERTAPDVPGATVTSPRTGAALMTSLAVTNASLVAVAYSAAIQSADAAASRSRHSSNAPRTYASSPSESQPIESGSPLSVAGVTVPDTSAQPLL